ncbi:MarR family winged helix-turn-helix transcriptional regulator [Nocardioides marmoraquaticus]
MSNHDLHELSNELVVLSARLVREVRRNIADVPAASTRLLSLLDELGPSPIGVLAEADRCSQPTMSGLVKGLVEKGWVSRAPHPGDARASVVDLTAEGRAALTDLRRRNADLVARRLTDAGASRDDLAAAVTLLHHVLGRNEQPHVHQ